MGSHNPLSKHEFGRTVAARIKKAGEPGAVSYDSKEQSITIRDGCNVVGILNLHRLYEEYLEQPASQQPDFLGRVVRLGLLRHQKIPEEFADAKPDIVPAVKRRDAFALKWLEQEVQGKPVEAHLPRACIGDHLLVMPVYNLPHAMKALTTRHLDQWGVSVHEAMEAAIQNLAEIDFPFRQRRDNLYGVQTDDSYDSSRLLLLDFARRLKIRGDPIAMVPHRDILLITGSENIDALTAMASMAYDAFDHPRYLTLTALRLEGDAWVSWMPPRYHPLFDAFRYLEVKSLFEVHERQKELLDTFHQKRGMHLHVGEYQAWRDRKGAVFSRTVWTDGLDSLLPETHKVFLQRRGKGVVAAGDWDRVQQIAGHLMEPLDTYPRRYRVRQFPSEEQLTMIGK